MVNKVDNRSRVPVFVSHTPAGASVQCLEHYSQIIRSGVFAYYDHGEKENIRRYGTKTAPPVPLQNITASSAPPIQIVTGTRDKLASLQDVRWLRDTLGEEVVVDYQELELSHVSYTLGKNMGYLTDHVLPFLLSH